MVSVSHRMRALIVDDEASICESLGGVLVDEGWKVVSVLSGVEGLREFQSQVFDLVFLDMWMEGLSGIETLQQMRDDDPTVPVVAMSGHGTIETAVKVTKLGAMQFLEKPLSLDKLLPILDKIQQQKNQPSTAVLGGKHQLIGESAALHLVRKQIRLIAPRSSWVLVTGPHGSGKEVVARSIHHESQRKDEAFVAVNCAAIPEDLVESELFGHTQGSFTGATQDKPGKFEQAHKGTIFFDEIGDMSLKAQAKILRILQEQQFERVGGGEIFAVDVRVIAATNKDLTAEIARGRFREDLYYRLNVVPIHLPSLQERVSDIPLIADHFLAVIAREFGEDKKVLSPEALEVLQAYSWPGNVRQLRNVMERICLMVSAERVEREYLPPLAGDGLLKAGAAVLPMEGFMGFSWKEAKEEFEKSYLLLKLDQYGWNVAKTADAVGMDRSTLRKKLRYYHMPKKPQENS